MRRKGVMANICPLHNLPMDQPRVARGHGISNSRLLGCRKSSCSNGVEIKDDRDETPGLLHPNPDVRIDDTYLTSVTGLQAAK
jgi:hypothetical protein